MHRFFSISILFLNLTVTLACYGQYECPPCPPAEECQECDQNTPNDVWEYSRRVYLDHVEGRWLDNTQGYTSLGIFSVQPGIGAAENLLPFLDARGHCFNNGKLAGNLGAGFRYADFDHCIVYGINAYYDYRKAAWDNHLHQIGAGLEILSQTWDFRLNGYIPVGKTIRHRQHRFQPDTTEFREKTKKVMWGIDAEVGRWLLNRGPCDLFDLYGALGAYYYSSDARKHKLYGAEARLTSHIGRYFAVEVKGGYDQVYKGSFQARVTAAIPLETLFAWTGYSFWRDQCDFDGSMSKIIYQPVQRQEIIVLDRSKTRLVHHHESFVSSPSLSLDDDEDFSEFLALPIFLSSSEEDEG